MAETSEAGRQTIERIRDEAAQALRLVDRSQEKRSLAWTCGGCGHIKHFTRPVLADVPAPYPKCGGEAFEPLTETAATVRDHVIE
jgi:hypothetical protein